MDLDEYFEAIMDWVPDLDAELTDEELDDMEFTVRSIVMQMGWTTRVSIIEGN